jgi:hypothetical protein
MHWKWLAVTQIWRQVYCFREASVLRISAILFSYTSFIYKPHWYYILINILKRLQQFFF